MLLLIFLLEILNNKRLKNKYWNYYTAIIGMYSYKNELVEKRTLDLLSLCLSSMLFTKESNYNMI